jgi:hypothetical protein
MIDLYLLTAPILLLGIVALLRFVGCGFAPQAVITQGSLSAQPGNAEVTLSWTGTDTDTTGYSYQINRRNDNLPSMTLGPTTDTSFVDNTVTNGIEYKYTVTLFLSGTNEGTTNEVTATPAMVPGRPPGSVWDPNNALSANLIGLFLMNEGTEAAQGTSAPPDINRVDGATANPAGNAAPTWEVADPSIVFHGGGSLNSYLDAGVDLLFNNMPTDQITIVAKVLVNALFTGGICEKNDGKPPGSDSGFIFAITNTGALHVKVELSTQSMVLETNGGVVTAGQWMQLAFTWDGTQYNAGTKTAPSTAAAIFVNQTNQAGNLNAMTTHNGMGTLDTTRLSNNQPFRIGNVSYDFASSLYGKIAYMAVYKGRLLTPTDLATLDSGLPIKQA